MTLGATDPPPEPRNRKVMHVSSTRHGGARGFTNLVMAKVDGAIVRDPHVTGQCVLELEELEAVALRDQLTEWLR